MSVLEQNHFKYDEYSVMDTVIMGNRRLYDIMKEKDALYMKPDFSDEDGERAAVLEGEFAEMNGWDAETEAAQLLNGIGIPTELHQAQMSRAGWPAEGEGPAGAGPVRPSVHHSAGRAHQRSGRGKHRMAGRFSGGLRAPSSSWSAMTATSSTRCAPTSWTWITRPAKCTPATTTSGTSPSQLFQQLMRNSRTRSGGKDQATCRNLSAASAANKSKSRQATSRKKVLDSMQIEQMPASSRKYPFVGFEPERESRQGHPDRGGPVQDHRRRERCSTT